MRAVLLINQTDIFYNVIDSFYFYGTINVQTRGQRWRSDTPGGWGDGGGRILVLSWE